MNTVPEQGNAHHYNLVKWDFLNQKTFGAMIFDQKIIFQQDKIGAASFDQKRFSQK